METTQARRRALWTAAALATGVVLHASTIAMPLWASGETYHLASSKAFRVDLSAGLWGYCRTVTFDAESPARQDCYAFHTTISTQELSVCEAYARGFVYGTDDVRGVRLPVGATYDVHRIERPPTSLDDVNIQRFIEKSCSGDGHITFVVAVVGFTLSAATLFACLWSLVRQPSAEDNKRAMQANASLLQFTAMCAVATIGLWLVQSSDLRLPDESGAYSSIRLGYAVYLQLVAALFYCVTASRLIEHGKGTIQSLPSTKVLQV